MKSTSKTSLLVPSLFQWLKPLTPEFGCNAEARWGYVFRSVLENENLQSSTISRYMTGKRCIPKKYPLHYADRTSPRRPAPLYLDIDYALQMMAPDTSRCRKMLDALVLFISENINPIDQPFIMPGFIPTIPGKSEVANLFTVVLWYCICHDVTGM